MYLFAVISNIHNTYQIITLMCLKTSLHYSYYSLKLKPKHSFPSKLMLTKTVYCRTQCIVICYAVFYLANRRDVSVSMWLVYMSETVTH